MPITVKFFASLRERLGRSEDRVQAAPGMTVQNVWTRVSHGLPLPANILIAINQDYATLAAPVHDGDEVAFFPPITGGCRSARGRIKARCGQYSQRSVRSDVP